jgi:hypothetical protein
MNWRKQSLALAFSGSLVLSAAQTGCADQVRQSMMWPSIQTVDQSAGALDQLVAPIALYPDSLVAQILTASVWPAQVVEADRWMQQHSDLRGTALAEAVDPQTWDPSVKALTQFPLVLANMDKNLAWSSALGSAYASGPQDVLDAIQVMRRRAEQAGHLRANPHEIVTIEGDTILIQPADAETVYLPEYDPWLVYGAPTDVYPGWNEVPGLFVTEPDILFGVGVGIGTFGGFGWGWHHWGADWRGRGIVFNQRPYHARSPDFANHEDFHGAHAPFVATDGFRGGIWHGPIGAGNRAFSGFNHAGRGFGGGFHITTGGFHGGGFHGGGFHGGGHR